MTVDWESRDRLIDVVNRYLSKEIAAFENGQNTTSPAGHRR